MNEQQPTQKELLRNIPGFAETVRGAILFLVALLVFFFSDPLLLRVFPAPGTNRLGGWDDILISTIVFFLLVMPLTFISIVYLGRGLSELLGTRRTVGSLMLLLALLLILFTSSPYSYHLFQFINKSDFGLLPFFAYIISISLGIEGTILVVHSFVIVFKKRREEKRQEFDLHQ